MGLVCLLAAGVACCSSTRYAERADEIVEAPRETVRLEGLGADRWCSDFGDAGLDATVRRAWEGNLELKAAWARLRQAEAVADLASAARWPTLGAGAEATYSREPARDFGPDDGGAEAFWELSALAAYEVDVWGRYRDLERAAELEAAAAEAAARALAITLTSEVAEAWFDVIAERERLRLLEEQLEVSERVLELIRLRWRRGLAPGVDVAQQEQNVESIRGQATLAQGRLDTSMHRLAVLVGRPPDRGPAVDGATLPEVEPLAEAGVPADLLERRPDVREAYLLLEAADERTAAAAAERLPQLRLSASIGFQAEQIAKLFEQLFWSLGAGAFQPVFEGGRLRARVERQEAIAEEQLYGYANTLLVAMREVRDALALEQSQRLRLESLAREETTAGKVLELAQKRYRYGAIDYLRVLTALQAQQEVERTLLEARRQQLSHRIALCRALGGSWVESVQPSIDED